MFMDTPETLIYITAGAFFLGWVVGKIGAYFGNRVKAKNRDPRDDRIRSLEAELRHVLTQAADQHERMAAFRRDAARIRAMTPKDRPQTDSTLLIREDRDR